MEFFGLRAADGILPSIINYTVSCFRRDVFFYTNHLGATFSYATATSTSVEATIAYANLEDLAGEINRIKCFHNIIFCSSHINGARGDGDRL
jgi:hypothetical protein